MSAVTLVVLLVAVIVAWKILKGFIKIGVIFALIAVACYVLLGNAA